MKSMNTEIFQEMLNDAKSHRQQAEVLELSIGPAIRKTRTAMGITLRKMASQMGISPAYLSDIEQGRRKVSDNVLKKLIAFKTPSKTKK